MENIFEKLLTNLPIEIRDSFKEHLLQNSKIIHLKKGDVLVDEFTQQNKMYRILSGSCIRYVVNPVGEERAVMFHIEDFLPVIEHFQANKSKSLVTYTIKTNEKTEILAANIQFMHDNVEKFPALSHFLLQQSIEQLSIMNQFQNHLIGLSSEEFLKWLMNNYSFIFQRFSSQDIANFMDITPVWLSNLKRKISKK